MSRVYGPSIVRDGLILYADAANSKSYPGTGTTWYDLSRNGNNVTIDSLTFNQNDNLGSIQGTFSNNSLNSINDNDPHTVTLVGKSLVFNMGNGVETITNSVVSFNKYVFDINHDSNSSVDLFYDNLQTKTINITYTVSNLKSTVYVNGEKKEELTGYSGINDFGPFFSMIPGKGETLSTVYMVKIYNRVLTEDEVKQDFEATRTRFDL